MAMGSSRSPFFLVINIECNVIDTQMYEFKSRPHFTNQYVKIRYDYSAKTRGCHMYELTFEIVV